jgi:2,3-bisphosphoglycerate-independent phosphoglycerate mutase
MHQKSPLALIILDGFGYSPEKKYNAIAHARTPHLDKWFSQYHHSLLRASGPAVGLPDGYAGNSEVGHLTIGAGRVVLQPITLINNAIYDHTFFSNQTLITCLDQLAATGKTLHIMGLLSDAGVHSHIKHLFAFLKAAQEHNIHKIVIHAFLDGRDTPPRSAALFLTLLQQHIASTAHIVIGSIHGRYYAMDRDNNWERTEQSYRVLTTYAEKQFNSWPEILEHYYKEHITDEFIPPTQLHTFIPIQADDGVIFFNVRPDRARQLTAAFCDPLFNDFPVRSLPLIFFMTPVSYNDMVKTTVLFPQQPLVNTLKHFLARHNKTMFSIAETEKYAHITYFISGGTESPFDRETRVVIPSLKVDYAHYPTMSAQEITDAVLISLRENPCDFYFINYANADMVGHTGNFQTTVSAIECIDNQLEQLYKLLVEKMNGIMMITADHGNAELMFDDHTQQPHTAHTLNPVPFMMISTRNNLPSAVSLTQLSDITPFIMRIIKQIDSKNNFSSK